MNGPVHPAGCTFDPQAGTWLFTSGCALEHPVDHDAPLQRAVPTELLGVVEPADGVVSSVQADVQHGTIGDVESADGTTS